MSSERPVIRNGFVAVQVGLLAVVVLVVRDVVAQLGQETSFIDLLVVLVAATFIRSLMVRAELGSTSVLVVNLLRTGEIPVDEIEKVEASRVFLPSQDGLWGGALGIRLRSGKVVPVQASHLSAIGRDRRRLTPPSSRRWAIIERWLLAELGDDRVQPEALILPGATFTLAYSDDREP